MSSPTAVRVQAVSKTYNPRSNNSVRALQNVSFDVQQGEVVGLIGPNGAGKSTLLRIILGFLDADSGSVTVFDEHPESLSARAKIGYQADSQFQSKAVSARRFLELHAALLELPNGGDINVLLREFNLADVAKRSLVALSKGLRQKVELALAFLGSPQIVFLDEPTASLDPPSVFKLRDFVAKRKGMGMTLFFNSHNLTEVEHVCDRVLFIDQGQLLADYSMRDTKPRFLEEAFRRHLVEKRL